MVKQSPAALENGESAPLSAAENGNVNGTEHGGEGARRAEGAQGAKNTKDKSWLRDYKVPNKPLEELAEGWKETVKRGQVLSFRRHLGIYNLLQPAVLKIQAWLAKKKQVREE